MHAALRSLLRRRDGNAAGQQSPPTPPPRPPSLTMVAVILRPPVQPRTRPGRDTNGHHHHYHHHYCTRQATGGWETTRLEAPRELAIEDESRVWGLSHSHTQAHDDGGELPQLGVGADRPFFRHGVQANDRLEVGGDDDAWVWVGVVGGWCASASASVAPMRSPVRAFATQNRHPADDTHDPAQRFHGLGWVRVVCGWYMADSACPLLHHVCVPPS